MANELDKELFHCILQLNEQQKKSVLQMLKTFLTGRELKTPGMTIDWYNKEIADAIARVEAGEFYAHEDVESMAKEW
jgi:hypothetical protein